MADKLFIYNSAITLTGGDLLGSLTDEGGARRLCDQFYAAAIQEILEAAAWKFAMRTISLSADASKTTAFGYANAFSIPTDWSRTYIVSSVENLDPLNDYVEESGYLYAGPDTLYCRFVSNGVTYGNDIGRWSMLFAAAVAAKLAEKIVPRLTESLNKSGDIKAEAMRTLRKAKSADAFKEGVKFPPAGQLVRSRMGQQHNNGGWR